jgi:hypothetical protein
MLKVWLSACYTAKRHQSHPYESHIFKLSYRPRIAVTPRSNFFLEINLGIGERPKQRIWLWAVHWNFPQHNRQKVFTCRIMIHGKLGEKFHFVKHVFLQCYTRNVCKHNLFLNFLCKIRRHFWLSVFYTSERQAFPSILCGKSWLFAV